MNKKLKKDEISIVKISSEKLTDILKEYLFEHCCEISGISNKIEDVVSSVMFKSDADGLSAYLLVANDEDLNGINKIDLSAQDLEKLDLKNDSPAHLGCEEIKKKLK